MFLRRYRRSKVGGMGFLKLISQAFPHPLPQPPLVFPALLLALFFARAPLSECLEQAMCAHVKKCVWGEASKVFEYHLCANQFET